MYIRKVIYVYTCGRLCIYVRKGGAVGVLGGVLGGYCSIALQMLLWGGGTWWDEREIESIYYISIYILYY